MQLLRIHQVILRIICQSFRLKHVHQLLKAHHNSLVSNVTFCKLEHFFGAAV